MLKVQPEKEDEIVAKFKAGDKVEVQAEAKTKVELLGAKGTIVAQRVQSTTTPGGPWQPVYEIQFEGMQGIEIVDEEWLTAG